MQSLIDSFLFRRSPILHLIRRSVHVPQESDHPLSYWKIKHEMRFDAKRSISLKLCRYKYRCFDMNNLIQISGQENG